jgi:hypothetical protein
MAGNRLPVIWKHTALSTSLISIPLNPLTWTLSERPGRRVVQVILEICAVDARNLLSIIESSLAELKQSTVAVHFESLKRSEETL